MFNGDEAANREALVSAFATVDGSDPEASAAAQRAILDDLTQLRISYGEAKDDPGDLETRLVGSGMLLLLSVFLDKFSFEARKEVCKLFESLLNRRDGVTARVVGETPELLERLLQGYATSAAVISGSILRACIKHKALATQILRSEGFWSLFGHMQNNNFDVASDAVGTFKELLVKSETKKTTAEFLAEHYERFCGEYSQLLASRAPEAYFARRQLLKLLGELLLDRTNFNVMKRYIQSVDNLKLMMTLFKDKSDHIRFEAFNVFKVFVANPDKPPPVRDILQRNQGRLIQYLQEFHPETIDDETFREDKLAVIEELEKLSTVSTE